MSTFEYRKLLRASVKLRVRCRAEGIALEQSFVFSKNISCVGIHLVMSQQIEKGTELEMQIYLSEGREPVISKGRVVWQSECSYMPKSKHRYYLTGIQFIHMSPDDAIETSDFVKDVLNEHSQKDNESIIEMIENLRAGNPEENK